MVFNRHFLDLSLISFQVSTVYISIQLNKSLPYHYFRVPDFPWSTSLWITTSVSSWPRRKTRSRAAKSRRSSSSTTRQPVWHSQYRQIIEKMNYSYDKLVIIVSMSNIYIYYLFLYTINKYTINRFTIDSLRIQICQEDIQGTIYSRKEWIVRCTIYGTVLD